jgi:hypothetical protein
VADPNNILNQNLTLGGNLAVLGDTALDGDVVITGNENITGDMVAAGRVVSGNAFGLITPTLGRLSLDYTEVLVTLTGATTTFSFGASGLPAEALVIATSIRVVTAITGITSTLGTLNVNPTTGPSPVGFINAFTGALHFFQKPAAALNCRPLIAQLGESSRKSSMAIAKRCCVGNMDVNIGLKANRLVQCHHAPYHVLVARRALRVQLNDERLTTTLNAGKLLFQSALALIDRGKVRSSAGDFPISRDGLFAQAIRR